MESEPNTHLLSLKLPKQVGSENLFILEHNQYPGFSHFYSDILPKAGLQI